MQVKFISSISLNMHAIYSVPIILDATSLSTRPSIYVFHRFSMNVTMQSHQCFYFQISPYNFIEEICSNARGITQYMLTNTRKHRGNLEHHRNKCYDQRMNDLQLHKFHYVLIFHTYPHVVLASVWKFMPLQDDMWLLIIFFSL